ncbi:MAG: AMP-binding protein [Chloroflexi bacterium]|nr:AMP-binding protein [Chloroflexota bacterium]
MLVRDFLEQSASKFGSKVALVFEDQRLTYEQIDAMANRLANALIAAGVRRGDRVAIYLGNSVEAVVSIFAALKANGVFVVINPTTKEDKLAFVLNNCQARALIGHARLASILHQVCPQVPSLAYLLLVDGEENQGDFGLAAQAYEAVQMEYPSTRPARRCIDIDLAALIYTSGSTGFPKGVMSTHLNMITAATSITSYLENVPEDIIINVLPLSFDYGLYQVLMAFMVGATLVLERGFVYPHAILRRIAAERVTGFPIVPTISAMLLQLQGVGHYDCSSLRYITNTGAALPVSHIRRLQELFPWVTLYSMYGLTECKRVSYLPPAELARRPDSVGIAIPNTEVWIENEQGERVGPGEIGELVVRGSHVTRGYWQNPEETAKMFKPGPLPGEFVLHTGDLFRMDEEGFLYFVARKDDIIKSRGEKVSPKEIENVLYTMPEVLEAAVVGVPDPVLGEAIKAIVVPMREGALTEREVIAHCKRHLEDYMVPSLVEIRRELPKTSSGKIRKTALRDEALS